MCMKGISDEREDIPLVEIIVVDDRLLFVHLMYSHHDTNTMIALIVLDKRKELR